MVYMDSFCGVSQNCQVRCFFVVRIQGRDLFSKVFEAIFQVSSSEKNKKNIRKNIYNIKSLLGSL